MLLADNEIKRYEKNLLHNMAQFCISTANKDDTASHIQTSMVELSNMLSG